MAATGALRRSDVEDMFTLTPLQQGMLSYAVSGLHAFQERSVTSLCGHLNLEAFSAAWQAVVNRHSALRSAFLWHGVKVPHQIVFRRAGLRIRHVDWSRLDDESQERQLRRLLAAPANWTLDRAPLMTIFLVRAGTYRFHLAWTISHLVTDAFSFSVIIEDLLQRYRLALEGRPWNTQTAPSFRAYVAWVKRQDFAPSLAAWQQEVGSRAVPAPAPLVSSSVGASRRTMRELTLSSDLTRALQSFSVRHRTSLFVIYLGSWALVQSAMTMTASPMIAIVTSCRSLPIDGLDSMVGLVMNSVPVRIDVPERETLGRWLSRLGDEVQRQLRFEHVPFERLQETCAARGVRTEVAFNYLNVNRAQMRGPGFDVTGFRQALSSNFPIGVDVTPGARTLIEVSCEPSAMATATVERMLHQWHDVLARIPSHDKAVATVARAAMHAATAVRAAEVAQRRQQSLPEWMH